MRHMDNTLFYIPPVMVIMHVATTPRPATLTLLDATLTRGLFVNPVESTLTKNRGWGRGYLESRFSGFDQPPVDTAPKPN